MAGNFKVGDLVWAKMKGFPSWPGKVIAPKPEVKRPANKKSLQFVFFFGSENYAWIPEDSIYLYEDNRTKFLLSQRIPRGYKEAIEAIEDALKNRPSEVNLKPSELPSIEEELAQIFPQRKDVPNRDYSRDSGRKKKRLSSLVNRSSKSAKSKDRQQPSGPDPSPNHHMSATLTQKKNGKGNTPSARRESQSANKDQKDTPKSKKSDKTATPKVTGKSDKSHSKSHKKVRKHKGENSSKDSKSETNDVQTNSVDAGLSGLNTNHRDQKDFMPGDDESLPTRDPYNPTEPASGTASPDIFDSDGEDSKMDNDKGPKDATETEGNLEEIEEPSLVLEEPPLVADEGTAPIENEKEAEVEIKPLTEHVIDTPSPPPPPPPPRPPQTVKEPSSRGENIFEMFQPKESGILYGNPEEDEDDEKGENADDSMDYAVVTVDPDGQAHVLIENTIIDNEVVVLGQEEEVATEEVETEQVETEGILEAGEMEQLPPVSEEVVVNEDEDVLDTTIEDEEEEEEVMEGEEEEEVNNVTPVDDLPSINVKSDDKTPLETEINTESGHEAEPQSENEAQLCEMEAEPEEEGDEEVEQEAVISDVGEKFDMPELEMEKQMNEDQDGDLDCKVDVKEDKSETDEGSKSDDTRTPTRRSTRTRIRKEEAAKEKTKAGIASVRKKAEPKVSSTPRAGRKPKETPRAESKPVTSRRGSGKRAASPINTSSKRGKITSKAPASPGRSAAPTDQRPSGGLPMDIMEPAVAGPPKHDVIPTPLKIGFLGLGIMGHGMVNNLIKSGHEVTVWNRTAQKCREFTKEGALKGNTPAEVVAACDITFSCVSDPAAVKDLVFGNCGVLQGIQPGKGYVDMSTIDPDTVADVHEAVTSQGGRFLEAPVVGSRGPAHTGDLVILAAGDRTLYEDCYSCFEAMGKKTFFLGETTSGCKMKLVVNMLMGTFVAGLAESLALADKVGLDQDALLQILDLSVMSCPLVRSKGQAIMMSRFEPQFPLQHQQKDLRLSINMADSVDQPLHVATATNELFKKAKAKGYSQHDMCAVYRAADM